MIIHILFSSKWFSINRYQVTWNYFMSQHYRSATNKQVGQSSTEIFRSPSREELRQAKEQEQARAEEKDRAVVTNYKDEDLSGCLSGCLSGSLKTPQKPAEQPKAVVTNYKDDDLSGCLSGWLKPKPTEPKSSHRDRFAPTQRNVKTGEITPIERDDLSGALAPLDEEKSGWLYFN
jgi:hypothetical protein